MVDCDSNGLQQIIQPNTLALMQSPSALTLGLAMCLALVNEPSANEMQAEA